jgi:hypothetical protein
MSAWSEHAHYGFPPTPYTHTPKRVLKEHRKHTWTKALHIDSAMAERKELYRNMLKKAAENPDNSDTKTIEKDLHRTFPVIGFKRSCLLTIYSEPSPVCISRRSQCSSKLLNGLRGVRPSDWIL